jgi:hypothetical protein
MSYKTPVIPTLTLKGLDSKIQTIQTKLASDLSWLSKSFGLADRIVELKNDKPYVYPAVFESNTIDPISLMPSDAYSAFCFWTKTGDSVINPNDNFAPKNPIIRQNVSCIFYMDIHRIDTVFAYKGTKSKITEDIFNFFNKVNVSGQLVAKKFTEDDITKVYEGFSLEQLDNKFKMYPRWACRMDFELSYRDSCYVNNTYTGTETGVTGAITCDMDIITVDNG